MKQHSQNWILISLLINDISTDLNVNCDTNSFPKITVGCFCLGLQSIHLADLCNYPWTKKKVWKSPRYSTMLLFSRAIIRQSLIVDEVATEKNIAQQWRKKLSNWKFRCCHLQCMHSLIKSAQVFPFFYFLFNYHEKHVYCWFRVDGSESELVLMCSCSCWISTKNGQRKTFSM